MREPMIAPEIPEWSVLKRHCAAADVPQRSVKTYNAEEKYMGCLRNRLTRSFSRGSLTSKRKSTDDVVRWSLAGQKYFRTSANQALSFYPPSHLIPITNEGLLI